jgi:hypothetical protein
MQPANLRPILHSDHSPIEGCSLFDRNHLLSFRPEPTVSVSFNHKVFKAESIVQAAKYLQEMIRLLQSEDAIAIETAKRLNEPDKC